MDQEEPITAFEQQLRELRPASASPELKNRIEQSIHPAPNRLLRGLIAAAIVTFAGLGFLLLQNREPDLEIKIAEPPEVKPVGHQHVLIGSSAPKFVEIPGSAPMWQIDMKLMNRAFIQTPTGVEASDFVPEDRTVFVPVVYH